MLEYHKSFPEDNARSLKLILLVVKDETIGFFLTRLIKRETTYHVIFAVHRHQALQVIQEVKPDLFILDYAFADQDGFELYDRLHTTEGLEGVPALLSSLSTRFPGHYLKHLYLRSAERSAELESFLCTIQEILL